MDQIAGLSDIFQFFRVVAAEEKDLTVLNYAPGPLDTPMMEDIIEGEGTRDDVRQGIV